MKYDFWNVKGLCFTAQGTAQRAYQVLTVNRDKCALLRQDGEVVELPLENVLRIVNSK